jgi:anti-anti-sigma regulatory factor
MYTLPRQDRKMTLRVRTVTVKQLPKTLNAQQLRAFLREYEDSLQASRPRIVLDCSHVQQIDRPLLHLLLCCLEEAMKLNGDVRLAAVSLDARTALELWGIGRLFKVFETNKDAIDSYQLPFGYSDGYRQPTENAA